MIIHNFEQHSEAWHEIRCGRVTGTRFKTLVSKEDTQGYKDLITELACEIITGKQEDNYVSADMQRGTDGEPFARAEYSALFGVEVGTCGFITLDEDNKYSEWTGISPDGTLSDNGILEIKCPKPKTHMNYIETNKLPSEYRYQVQGQLFVTGANYCDFMSYVEGMKPFIIRVYPDLDLFKEFERRLDILIEQVKTKLETYHKYDFNND